jgi:hypothetical protein
MMQAKWPLPTAPTVLQSEDAPGATPLTVTILVSRTVSPGCVMKSTTIWKLRVSENEFFSVPVSFQESNSGVQPVVVTSVRALYLRLNGMVVVFGIGVEDLEVVLVEDVDVDVDVVLDDAEGVLEEHAANRRQAASAPPTAVSERVNFGCTVKQSFHDESRSV